ncbi:5'-3' exonuclease [Mycoplasmopsis iners]|uniref:5'-3' exonuclease n=1 Tax=Mycoplasmopsis iners TaxID=76630 RepID=UPI0004959888|nr:5'-3' exonuclease H3TH domain-containing protein [Mycoplasmopsis iners]
MQKKLLLIDGNLLMFQSFYASYNPYNLDNLMTSPKGITTNGVHVFLVTLAKLLNYVQPDYLFVAFDAHGKTKRHEQYKAYKSGRNKAPEIIFDQFALIKEILSKINVNWLEKLGDEADDLIATLAKKSDMENYIYSKDKDLLQLVDSHTVVLKNSKEYYGYDEINIDNFKEIYGIKPNQIPDFKGLAGDSSDNLIGVSGIGEKGAVKLINEFGSLDKIYEQIDNIKGKTKEKLLNDKASAFMCKDLATLNFDVDMDFNWENYAKFLKGDLAQGIELLEEHGLHKAMFNLFNNNLR